jgi:hypothetical protein
LSEFSSAATKGRLGTPTKPMIIMHLHVSCARGFEESILRVVVAFKLTSQATKHGSQ